MKKGQNLGWGALLFGLCGLVLLRTMCPTFFNFDSAEFSIAAKELGIVHSPGYPLYILIAHIFTYLPFGDIGYRVNLLSVFSLAGTAPFLFHALTYFVDSKMSALTATLLFIWSYYVWINGLVAEIYAPQLFVVTVLIWSLVQLHKDYQFYNAVGVGIWVGVTLALSPSLVLFTPGVALVFIGLKLPRLDTILAGISSVIIFGAFLLYFPLSASQHPAINLASSYSGTGEIVAMDMTSPSTVIWFIRGGQFDNLFFQEGFIPPIQHVVQLGGFLWANYLGIGVIIGLVGLNYIFQHQRKLFFIWLSFIGPTTYFYMTYGADDVFLMLGPIYLLWTFVIAYGLRELTTQLDQRINTVLSFILVGFFFIINFPLVDLSNEYSVRTQAEEQLVVIPENSVVFGFWTEILPLQYLHLIEDQRSDIALYNLFLYENDDLTEYLETVNSCQQPIVFLGDTLHLLPDREFYNVDTAYDDIDIWVFRAETCPDKL